MSLQLSFHADSTGGGNVDDCAETNEWFYPTINAASAGTYSITADGTCTTGAGAYNYRFYCVSTDLMFVRLIDDAYTCAVGTNTPTETAAQIIGNGFIVNTANTCNKFYSVAAGRDPAAVFETNWLAGINAAQVTCTATDYVGLMTRTTFDCSGYTGSFPGMTYLSDNGGVACIGTPSARPSARPSSRPSDRPTKSPSSGRPTSNPTKSPTTGEPTGPPTTTPSERPTGSPTRDPSNNPTPPPTITPSNGPTNKPTGEPSNKPTVGPSPLPSIQPTPPPTSPSLAPTTQGPSTLPSPAPSPPPTPPPVSGSPTHRPSVNPTQPSLTPSPPPSAPSPPPTPPPSSSGPTPPPSSGAPSPPPTPPPVSASPSPPPTPPPTSAAPTMSSAPTMPPPTPLPTAATLFTVVNQSHGGVLKTLATPAERPIKAICSNNAWAKLNALVTATRDLRQDVSDWVEWKHDTTTVAPAAGTPTGEIDHTTAAPKGRLYTTEKSYAHPFSTTTARPDYTDDRIAAMEALVDGGQAAYDTFCAAASAHIADPMGEALASVWFEEQTKLHAPVSPYIDTWKVMHTNNVDRATNMALHNILVSADNQMSPAFEAACNHQHTDFAHINLWGIAWDAHVADIAYMNSIGMPLLQWDMTDSQQIAVDILSGFHAMTVDQRAALCAVGNGHFAPANPIDLEAGEKFWVSAHLIPTHDPNHYISRISRLQGLSKEHATALNNAPRSVLKAFAAHPETAKQECDSTLHDVQDVLVSGIWDSEHMHDTVEGNKRLSYFMRQCYTEEEAAKGKAKAKSKGRNTEERNLFVKCGSSSTWLTEHTVGGAGADISLAKFETEISGCYDHVTARMGQFFNKAKIAANANGDVYCQTFIDKLNSGGVVTLGDLAWWEFGTSDHPWFHCLENFRAQVVHPKITDTALQACSILSQVDSSVFNGLGTALGDSVEEQNMVDLRNYIDDVYSHKLVSTVNGWVTITRKGGKYHSKYVPTVEITAKAQGTKTKEQFAKDVQQAFNIGLADEVIEGEGGVFTARYDQPLGEVQPRMKWLAKIQTDGLKDYDLQSIAFPPHYENLHKSFEAAAGVKAHNVQYSCALHPQTGSMTRQDGKVEVPAPAPATDAPASDEPAPAAEVSEIKGQHTPSDNIPLPTAAAVVSEESNALKVALNAAGAALATLALY